MNACRYCKVVSRIRNVLRVALVRENPSNYSVSTYNVNTQTHQSSYLYRASMTIKTLYYPTGAQIYNSQIQLELL